jgi:hypothetical protein
MPLCNTRSRLLVWQQPDEQSRWSVRTLAAELGLPSSTVHGVLLAAKLQPHRIRTFTFSLDPDFEVKLVDIVGLYLNPPENALVLCVDEKPGIQAWIEHNRCYRCVRKSPVPGATNTSVMHSDIACRTRDG